MASVDPIAGTPDPGALANNYLTVSMLQSAFSRVDSNLRTIPKLVQRVIREGCWREWQSAEGKHVKWNPADFRRFLESPRPRGCETPIATVERVLRGTDVWEAFQELVRGRQGNPTGANQHTVGNRDDITDSSVPHVIPLPSVPTPTTEKPSRKRDYSREAPTGTSVSYAARRLSRERPDLYERVKGGEVSAHAAMREAGFTPQTVNLPVVPDRAAKLIFKHFCGPKLEPLMRELCRLCGLEVSEDSWGNLPR